MGEYEQQMNLALRPVAPPRVLEGIYTDDQFNRLYDIVKQHGPWPTIAAHHFQSVEELIATVTGIVPEGLDLTLDDIATPQFRGSRPPKPHVNALQPRCPPPSGGPPPPPPRRGPFLGGPQRDRPVRANKR